MTPYEEFEALCNKMDADLATERARQGAFINSVEMALIDLSIQLFPEVEAYKDEFIENLTIKAHQRAVSINGVLDSMAGGFSYEEIIKDMDMTVPPRDVTKEEEQFLEETLRNMPIEQHAYFLELNNERVKEEAIDREFVFQCHDKTKELIWKYFPEMIDFPANSIRYLNFYSYYEMDEWKFDFYYFAGEYMNDIDLD